MSAYVIDAETMDLAMSVVCGQTRWGYVFRTVAGVVMEHHATAEAATMIGRKWFAMCVESVTRRYPDCREHPENLPGPNGAQFLPEQYTFNGRRLVGVMDRAAWIAGYKALQCLEYQSCEGYMDETDEYKELVHISGEVAGKIIREMPEYDSSPGW
jgi:hypothetical protein